MPRREQRTESTTVAAPRWHTLSAEEVAERLSVVPAAGLAPPDAAERLARVGANELARDGRHSALSMLLEQFASPLVLVLIAAAATSAIVHDPKDAVVIGVILLLNAMIGFVQEYRADQSMRALQRMTVPQVRVRREGSVVEIPASSVVPGDMLLLQAGDLAPADARLLSVASLRMDESALTGESEPVDKVADVLDDPQLPLAERANMAYRGTAVAYGRGEALVVATGMQTELGAIAAALKATRTTETPLQRRLAALGKTLAIWALIVCAVLMFIGVVRGEPAREMLMTAIALAVAAIPEGLPAVVTIALALGARKMARRNALVRSLPAVEGLGSVTVICSDKTGTLTRNEMTVTDVMMHGQAIRVTGVGRAPVGSLLAEDDSPAETTPGLMRLLAAGALCNDASLRWDPASPEACSAVGDPTETALLTLAAKAQIDFEALQASRPRRAEVPFDSEIKRMATLHGGGPGPTVAAKGSPESLLEVCSAICVAGTDRPLDQGAREWVAEQVHALASRGRRVLALADRAGGAEPLDRDLTFLGLVGIIDPARPEAQAAVAECQSAGVRTVMITGDHKLTAESIARELGMLREGSVALTGRELDSLSDEELAEALEHVSVFARVTPAHKMRLVEALQARGEVVSMTGDGVNDAPALRRADIGVAMGVTGTDVAREASRLVLADDNFATIVAAVREGRVIYDNMRRFLRFLLNTNLAEILTMLVAIVLGWPVPLLAIQILWVNLLTDGLPALALGFERGDPDVMKRRPRDPAQSLLTAGMVRSIAIHAAVMAGGVLMAMRLGGDIDHKRTIAFTSLALAQIANCLACRSERRLLAEIGLWSNPHMVGAVALTLAAQAAVLHVPALQSVFGTVPLAPAELAACAAVCAAVFLSVELEKLVIRALERHRVPAAS